MKEGGIKSLTKNEMDGYVSDFFEHIFGKDVVSNSLLVEN